MTPHLWGGQEAISEEGIPEDGLKNEHGLARKGRGQGARQREGHTRGGGWWQFWEPSGGQPARRGEKQEQQLGRS